MCHCETFKPRPEVEASRPEAPISSCGNPCELGCPDDDRCDVAKPLPPAIVETEAWQGTPPADRIEPSEGRLLALSRLLPAYSAFDPHCGCGALLSDHLTDRPLAALDGSGGYCILRKNDRTRKIPGVLSLREVRL